MLYAIKLPVWVDIKCNFFRLFFLYSFFNVLHNLIIGTVLKLYTIKVHSLFPVIPFFYLVYDQIRYIIEFKKTSMTSNLTNLMQLGNACYNFTVDNLIIMIMVTTGPYLQYKWIFFSSRMLHIRLPNE